VDVLGLTRLRACPDYDDLTDAEHGAVLDARELLDELRPQGYGVTLARTGTLRVVPPAGADKEARSRIAALAPALAYVLRLERWADPLPEACRRCAAPVDAFSPNGHPYCSPCYAVAAARHERRQGERAGLLQPDGARRGRRGWVGAAPSPTRPEPGAPAGAAPAAPTPGPSGVTPVP
jgi:hypothetical protein